MSICANQTCFWPIICPAVSLRLLLPCSAGARKKKKKKTRWHHINMRHIVQPRDPAAEKINFFFRFIYFFLLLPNQNRRLFNRQAIMAGSLLFHVHIRTESLRVSAGKVTQTFGEGLGLRDTPYGCCGVEWLLRKLPFLFSPAATLGLFFAREFDIQIKKICYTASSFDRYLLRFHVRL